MSNKTNIEMLKFNHKDLYSYYLRYGCVESVEKVELFMTKDDKPVLRQHVNGRKRFVGNAYYFREDLKKCIDEINEINDFSLLLVFGFGTGDILRELATILPKNIILVVYEPSVELFTYVMNHIDISDVLLNERIHVFIDGINDEKLDLFLWDNIDETNYKINKLISLPIYDKIYIEKFDWLKDVYRIHLEHCVSDIASGEVHSDMDVENDILNLEYVAGCCCIDQFAEVFPVEYPVVIISAGPSLEKNGRLLHALKGKLMLVAVDTAIPYLLSIGVIPDLAISVSPNKDNNLKGLYDDPRLKNIPFAIDSSVTHTGISKVFGKRIIFISTSSPYYEKLFAEYNHSLNKLKSGGSVSTIAYSLLYEWGYRSFVFVGLDLSLKEEKLYAGNTEDEKVMGWDRIPVDGYYGGKVCTLNTYKIHLDWFESMAHSYKNVVMYNATEGGAMIHGMINCPLEKIVDMYADLNWDYELIFDGMDDAIDKHKKNELDKSFKHSVNSIEKIKKMLGDTCGLISESLSLLESDNSLIYNKLRIIYAEIDKTLTACQSMPESYYLERMVGDKHGKLLEDIFISKDNPSEEYKRILKKLHTYFFDMEEKADIVKGLFKKMIFDEKASINNELNSNLFISNLNALENLYGGFVERVNTIRSLGLDEESINPELEKSKNGINITAVNIDGKKIYINSQYNPIIEAEKYVSKYEEINDFSICMFLGLGNGIVAREILKKLPEHTTIVFYEPYPDLFLHVINNYDITDIIYSNRVRIFVKSINENEFDIYMSQIVSEANYRYTIYDALPKYRLIAQSEYEELFVRFERVVQGVKNNIETLKYQSKIEAKNNILNIGFLKDCCCEEQFRNVFPVDLPVVLVAAGPSVKKNIDKLKLLKGKLLIVAVDTVAKYLVANGVRPDIVVTVDPFVSEKVFDGMDDEKLICAYDTGANYNVIKATGMGRKIVISSRSAYYDRLMSIADFHMYQLNGGGSVSTIAFALAQSWGYKTFVLVGQDLALEGDVRYADNSLGIDYNTNDYELVEGYYGGLVKSPKDLKLYLDWYEMMARSYPDFTIINSTEGGAKIKGTIQRSLSEIADEYSNQNCDYEKLIYSHDVLYDELHYNQLKKYVSESVVKIKDMKEQLKKSKALINIVLEKTDGNELDVVEIKHINEQISRLTNKCADMEESYFIDSIIASKQADVLNDIYETSTDPKDEYIRILQKLDLYVHDMIDAMDEVSEVFEEVIGLM